jgi:hypothetical protein
VTGVDDAVDDGDIAYNAILGVPTTADPIYAAIDPADVALTNADNDGAGITVTPVAGLGTTEAGGTASFTVVLNSQPTANVIIPVASSDPSEGVASASSLTFTAVNWNIAQTVTATGVDDLVDDGDIAYRITLGAPTTADPIYAAIDPADVAVTNADNDAAGITVTPLAGLGTTEAGGAASFTVVLNSQPTANVTLPVASTDPSEGTVSVANLTFTAGNWNAPQTVTVHGVDDLVDDGNVFYIVSVGVASSADPGYSGIDPNDVTVVNVDNDTAGITVTPVAGLTTTEAGGTASFTVVLNSQPTANVVIPMASSDGSEGSIPVSSLTFTPADWSLPQTVTVQGVDDLVADGTVAYHVALGAAASTDGSTPAWTPPTWPWSTWTTTPRVSPSRPPPGSRRARPEAKRHSTSS